jgi:hypothetical protein
MPDPIDPALPRPVPTQVRRPWRSTLRTVFQAIIGFAVIAPLIVDAADLDEDARVAPYVAIGLGVCAAITRIMALPQVEGFLQKHVPFLSATPRNP